MGIKQRIVDDMKEAMKTKDQFRLDTLRLMKAAIMQKEVAGEAQRELTEEETNAVLQSLIKQRRDSIDSYMKANRKDLADKEAGEITVVEKYLPAAPTDAELAALIEAAVKESGAAGPKEMGKVMKVIKEKLAGRPVDGSIVSAKVKARLGG